MIIGDGCVSVGCGAIDLNISNINCRPGHGIRFVFAYLISTLSHAGCSRFRIWII